MMVQVEGSDAPSGAVVSVPLAIALGLLASFVQSLGLTIQRKAHLIASRQPDHLRAAEWRQPLWLLGFAIFIVANLGGTIFQIGALPIVMLAPLGAVSLLYNALLAKFLLEDALGSTMIGGTALILVGAVLIGYFGAIQEPPHGLDELLSLFGRPSFIALATILFMAVACILVLAHLAEWQLILHLTTPSSSYPLSRSNKSHRGKKYYARLTRRWSAPTLAPLDEVSETTSGVATPVLAVRDQERLQQTRDESLSHSLNTKRQGAHGGALQLGDHPRRDYGSQGQHEPRGSRRGPPRKHKKLPVPEISKEGTDAVKKTKLLLAVGFAAISGTLSGLCLLLAKSGVELLVLTFALGKNQFNRIGSWALVGIMFLAALAQLWYLNKALRMADPTLVCPLAFCFYNTSSIALGLVYFDQLSSLSFLSLSLIVTGIVILLTGVIVVSSKPPPMIDVDVEGDEVIGSNSSSLHRLLSPVNDDVLSPDGPTAIGSEGLLANAGGIAGPHLPPFAPASESPSSAAVLTDSPPQHLGSPLPGPTSSQRRSSIGKPRSRSSSQHHHIVGLGLQPAFQYVDISPEPLSPGSSSHHPSSTTPVAERSSPSSPRLPRSTIATNTAERGQRRRSSAQLYSAILSRGLSIGISPSSPGFHIGPFSPADEGEDEDAVAVEALAQERRRIGIDLEAQQRTRRTSSISAGGSVTTDASNENRGDLGRATLRRWWLPSGQKMDRRTFSEGDLDGMLARNGRHSSDSDSLPQAIVVEEAEEASGGSGLNVVSAPLLKITPPSQAQSEAQGRDDHLVDVQEQQQLPPPTSPSLSVVAAAATSAGNSAFRLLLPVGATIDSSILSERLSGLRRGIGLGRNRTSGVGSRSAGAGAGISSGTGGGGSGGSVSGLGEVGGVGARARTRAGAGAGAGAIPGRGSQVGTEGGTWAVSVRNWWSENVQGRQGFREGERRRLLEDG